MRKNQVVFLNPRTCGIYKSGGPRYRTDPETGQRTDVIDNELKDCVDAYLAGMTSPGDARVSVKEILRTKILVPTYFDRRHDAPIHALLKAHGIDGVTIGQLVDNGTLQMRGGHGSPGNDQRSGHIPYVKVSDIRGLRININPTNLVTESVARRHWKGESSGLNAWDVITPNRASSNIGEFAMLLPGEEQIVVTREVFVFRVAEAGEWNPFYLLWALSLSAVREQWRRIALMQTNREDCGDRYREITLPAPSNPEWARRVSKSFREYFTTVAHARASFADGLASDDFDYIANVNSGTANTPSSDDPEES